MESIRVFNRTITLEHMQRGVALGCIGLCVLMLWQNCVPEFSIFMAKRAENESKRQNIEDMRAETRNREQLRRDLDRKHASLTAMRSRFPSKSEILSTLIVDLSDQFRQADCELLTFTPGTPTPMTGLVAGELTQDLQMLPVSITARGGYSSLIGLFKRLSKYERVLDMRGLSLTPIGGDEGAFSNKLSIQFTLTTYVLGQ